MSRLDPTAVSEPVKVRRLEILTDPGGRRRWSAEEKASIVAEATAPGAVVSQVARRYGLTPQQVFTWRRTLQSPAASSPPAQPMAFAPVVVETPPAGQPAAAAIEIATGAVVVRVPAGADAATLRTVLRAVAALR